MSETAPNLPQPSIGRIVLYTLTDDDADKINKRRADTREWLALHQKLSTGAQVHIGSVVLPGDSYPAIITKADALRPDWCSAQVLLDGSDSFWVGSSIHSQPTPGGFHWPPRA